MRKLMLLCFVSLALFSGVNAQRGGERGGANAQETIRQMVDSMNLTDAQFDSVKNIFKDALTAQMELRKNSDLPREERMAKMKDINQSRNARLKAVLTEDQFKKFQEMEKRRRQDRREGGKK